MAGRKRGLYVSYNEKANGPFDEAVAISNTLGCVTWFDQYPLDPRRLEYPTDIVVRIKGDETYYRGLLLAVARADSLSEDFAEGERNHRPAAWLGKKHSPGQTFRAALFISRLRQIKKPPEVEDRRPPERPTYMNLEGTA